MPVAQAISADVLTPVIAYLRLTNGAKSKDGSGSFLLESVVNGTQGRYSYVGAGEMIQKKFTQEARRTEQCVPRLHCRSQTDHQNGRAREPFRRSTQALRNRIGTV